MNPNRRSFFGKLAGAIAATVAAPAANEAAPANSVGSLSAIDMAMGDVTVGVQIDADGKIIGLVRIGDDAANV